MSAKERFVVFLFSTATWLSIMIIWILPLHFKEQEKRYEVPFRKNVERAVEKMETNNSFSYQETISSPNSQETGDVPQKGHVASPETLVSYARNEETISVSMSYGKDGESEDRSIVLRTYAVFPKGSENGVYYTEHYFLRDEHHFPIPFTGSDKEKMYHVSTVEEFVNVEGYVRTAFFTLVAVYATFLSAGYAWKYRTKARAQRTYKEQIPKPSLN